MLAQILFGAVLGVALGAFGIFAWDWLFWVIMLPLNALFALVALK